ncbi:NUDIX domain-containing protein [Caenimonas sp. SL110]|uniref:NUDIX hydrolase n=1 Tax=Caenimonas sp. SL110 TaxID=1450524 RepID=UPI000653063A|nr:NUDIX domain-containing protein [Caenimonas sp. SL110]
MNHNEWVAALRGRADLAPVIARLPLWWGDSIIGSVEKAFFDAVLPAGAIGDNGWVQPVARDGDEGWLVNGELTATLAQIALALRDAGAAHTWRDEQLAVTDASGRVLGTVERAVVRQLGIASFAVHLAATSADGRHWVQQRSLTKPNDPGLWDTLMGGMVPAGDTLQQALERETWEEAGLKLDQLEGLAYGGRIATRRPCADGRAGYIVEQIDWYRCTLAGAVVPSNRDGEVEQFAQMTKDELRGRLEQGEFTTEAALILVAAGLTEG